MSKIFGTILVSACAVVCGAAGAADTFYAGAALGPAGNSRVQSPSGIYESSNEPLVFGVYGGYQFSDALALEAGYTDFGKYKLGLPATTQVSTVYFAGKAGMKLGAAWELYAKAGLARNQVALTGLAVDNVSKTRPMLALGAQYALTERIAVGLELVDYGNFKAGKIDVGTRHLQATVKYSF